MPKLYLLDSGIANFSLGNFGRMAYRPNLSSYIENFAFCEIMKYKPIHYQVYFWRTKLGTEIDFILEGNDELIPVEVRWQKNTPMTVPKNFISFLKTHRNVKKAVIVNKDLCKKIRWQSKDIYFVPAVLFGKCITKLV